MFENLLERIAGELESGAIPYMVIGGQAVLLYGEPRLTKDIDITLGVGSERVPDVSDTVPYEQYDEAVAAEKVESAKKVFELLRDRSREIDG